MNSKITLAKIKASPKGVPIRKSIWGYAVPDKITMKIMMRPMTAEIMANLYMMFFFIFSYLTGSAQRGRTLLLSKLLQFHQAIMTSTGSVPWICSWCVRPDAGYPVSGESLLSLACTLAPFATFYNVDGAVSMFCGRKTHFKYRVLCSETAYLCSDTSDLQGRSAVSAGRAAEENVSSTFAVSMEENGTKNYFLGCGRHVGGL